MEGQETPLPRGYRLRIAGFAVAAVAGTGLLYVGLDFLATLQRLDVVEHERDEWQRPAEILQALDLHDGQVVADLGCGSGYFALKLSRTVGSTGRVLAVDIRGLPLLFLRTRAWRLGTENVSVIRGRPDDPELPDDTLHSVLVLNTYHELEDAPVVLAHVHRALRPAGLLVVVDRGRRSAGTPTPGEHELTPTECEAGLRASGFEIVRRDDMFIDRPGDPDLWWMIVARRP
ncbi:MAG TPA: methyltransferase domain-containing protein [Anaeromyxobacteraceae bacterium]|nr:methyltransferase domain-containing protein [Anaeromyxobacteraceae bacterium]